MEMNEITRESIDALLNAHSILLFMKGTRSQPQFDSSHDLPGPLVVQFND